MSAYYYTPMRNIWVGALCALGIFLIAYVGWDRADKIITNIAGVSALGVALCPTTPLVGQVTTREMTVGTFHLAFAAVVFLMLGLMSLRFATRTMMPPACRCTSGLVSRSVLPRQATPPRPPRKSPSTGSAGS